MAKPPCRDGRKNNRPPVSGQFKPGQPGNPNGRPRGSQNRRQVIEKELNKTVMLTENGKRVRRKKWDLIVAQQTNKAAAGDLKAAQYVTDLAFKYGCFSDEGSLGLPALNVDEQLVFESLAERIRASHQPEQCDESATDEPASAPSKDLVSS